MNQTLEHLYSLIKHTLTKNGFDVNPYRKTKYGISFLTNLENYTSLISLSFKNDAISFSLDPKTHPILKTQLQALIKPHIDNLGKLLTFSPEIKENTPLPTSEPAELLGMASSGQNNVFGPLIECGVVITEKTRPILVELNLKDYKDWTFQHLQYVVSVIQKNCPFSHIVMNPDSFNEVYKNITNIYHMISWLQLRTIENIRRQHTVSHATSKFLGQKSLIESKLLLKGYNMVLFESPKVTFLAPLAAEVFSYYLLVSTFQKYSQTFGMKFEFGDFEKNKRLYNDFIHTFSEEELGLISKTHLISKEKT